MDSRESDEVNFKWEEGESLNSFVELGKVSILIKTSRHRRKERWKISRILPCQLQSVEFKFGHREEESIENYILFCS